MAFCGMVLWLFLAATTEFHDVVSYAAKTVTMQPAGAAADELGPAVQNVLRQIDPCIVRLRMVGSSQAADGPVAATAPSTGLVISDAGEILTSEFALQGNPQAVIAETISGNRVPAEIIATDHVRRLVLLRARGETWAVPAMQPRAAARVGQWVVAIGRFFAADASNVSVGVVSARDRIHGMALQTDARISPLNYGGPLVDLSGQGSDSASAGVEWYDSGIGFAIPIEDALNSVARLRAGKDLKPGRAGIRLRDNGPFAEELIVEDLHAGGPAEQAGMRKGDRIRSANGQAVVRSGVLTDILSRAYAGDSLVLGIERNGAPVTVTVALADQLPVLPYGFLGLLPLSGNASRVPAAAAAAAAPVDGSGADLPVEKPAAAVAAAETEIPAEAVGVDVVALENSPAAVAGLSGVIRIRSVRLAGTGEEIPTATLPDLLNALERVTTGDVVGLSYRASKLPEEATATLTAAERPASPIPLTKRNLEEYGTPTGTTPDAAVRPVPEESGAMERSEIALADAGKCVVFRAGRQVLMRDPGILILLSTAGQTEESILRRWQHVMSSRSLALAIPANAENTRLTVEDTRLVLASAISVSIRHGIDRSRILIVAERSEADLARELLLARRSPVSGAAMLSGWFTLRPGDEPGRSRRTVLLLDRGQNRESSALAQRAELSLTEGGLQVLKPDGVVADQQDSVPEQVADWSLILKAL